MLDLSESILAIHPSLESVSGTVVLETSATYPNEALSIVSPKALSPLGETHEELLIASGADVKVVQARLRHKSATTTLRRSPGPP
jgi:hypothetical protein